MGEIQLHLSEASGVPRYRQIVDQLAEQIRVGRLHGGDQLPSFRELAPQLLVSVITVRKAYEELEAAGLIVRRQGQGTFVADDVAASSEGHARQQAQRVLDDAVQRASQLGMTDKEIQAHVRARLGRRS